jgi:hypothetical protein
MQSVHRRSTLFTVWIYSAESVEMRLCGGKYRAYRGDGRWEDRKGGTYREKRKGRKLVVKHER